MIFAGGYGTRISEETVRKPKPLISIGGLPIIVHIMKHYAKYGVNEFIILAGYKAIELKKFFSHYALYTSDIEVDLKTQSVNLLNSSIPNWKIKVIDTGLDTMTGGRLLRAKKHLEDDPYFYLTYGDGISTVNVGNVLNHHLSKCAHLTMTAVKAPSRFGVLELSEGSVTKFREKATIDGDLINAGFFVAGQEIFDYLEDDSTVFENQPMQKLCETGKLAAYTHDGFWHPMDTLRDRNYLDELLTSGKAQWI